MRKKILILGHNDATQFVDIYNQYTRVFDKQHYIVTVALLNSKATEAVKNKLIAEKIIFFDLPKKSLRNLKIKAIFALFKLCRQEKFEMVICHRYKPIYLLLWVRQFCFIPKTIFVMHELRTLKAIGRKLLIRALFKKNMYFAGVSNAVRDDLRQSLGYLPKENIITLYNMIDVDLSEPQLLSKTAAREKLNLHPEDFVFGNVARLAPNKDQHTLIKAFSAIKPFCPKAKLIILGEGELAEALKAEVSALGLEKEVRFTGFIANGASFMKAFDCFVLSSIQEAFGRVLIEAMIAKQPLIATHVHGIPEVVGDAGILVSPRDSKALADAMKFYYFLSPTEKNEHGEKAYRRAFEHFSIPAFYKQFWAFALETSPNP